MMSTLDLNHVTDTSMYQKSGLFMPVLGAVSTSKSCYLHSFPSKQESERIKYGLEGSAAGGMDACAHPRQHADTKTVSCHSSRLPCQTEGCARFQSSEWRLLGLVGNCAYADLQIYPYVHVCCAAEVNEIVQRHSMEARLSATRGPRPLRRMYGTSGVPSPIDHEQQLYPSIYLGVYGAANLACKALGLDAVFLPREVCTCPQTWSLSTLECLSSPNSEAMLIFLVG